MTDKRESGGALRFAARLVSLLAAAAIVAVIVFYPRLIAQTAVDVPHGFLVLMLIGMSFAWVHGFGFVPEHRLLRPLFTPLAAWPLMLLGAWGVFWR